MQSRSFVTSFTLKKQTNASISARTIHQRLQEAKLYVRRPRKVPLLSKKNIRDRLTFANKYLKTVGEQKELQWRNILWSDETKINLFGSDSSDLMFGSSIMRRPPNAAFNPKFTKKTVKFGGGNIMVWGCFSYDGVGPLYGIKEKMTKEIYRDILNDIMLSYVKENLPLI